MRSMINFIAQYRGWPTEVLKEMLKDELEPEQQEAIKRVLKERDMSGLHCVRLARIIKENEELTA